MLRTITASNIKHFHKNLMPAAGLNAGFMIRRGIPPSNVPLGQIHSQNQGSPLPAALSTVAGRIITKSASKTNLK